jgi:hypothetical protein
MTQSTLEHLFQVLALCHLREAKANQGGQRFALDLAADIPYR